MTPAASEPRFALILCPDLGKLACRLVRAAAARVKVDCSDVELREPGRELPDGAVPVFIDGSRECRAARQDANAKSRLTCQVYLPELIARRGLARLSGDAAAWEKMATAVIAQALLEELEQLRARRRERQAYLNSLVPVLERSEKARLAFAGAGPPPNSPGIDGDLAKRVDLDRKRFRNLFVKFDEILPPVDLSTAHDLFQDALLCLSYAAGAWLEGNTRSWSDFLEKADSQVRPLLNAVRNGISVESQKKLSGPDDRRRAPRC